MSMLKNSDLVGAGPKLLALTIRIFKWNLTRDITSLKFFNDLVFRAYPSKECIGWHLIDTIKSSCMKIKY